MNLGYHSNNDGIDYTYILQMIERAYKNQTIKAIVADGNKIARSTQVDLLKKFNITIMVPFFKTSKTSFLISPFYDTSGNSFTPSGSKLLAA